MTTMMMTSTVVSGAKKGRDIGEIFLMEAEEEDEEEMRKGCCIMS